MVYGCKSKAREGAKKNPRPFPDPLRPGQPHSSTRGPLRCWAKVGALPLDNRTTLESSAIRAHPSTSEQARLPAMPCHLSSIVKLCVLMARSVTTESD